MNRKIMLTTLSLCIFSIMIATVLAEQVKVINVNPMTTNTLTFNLDKTQKVTGSLSISGGSGNDINFWITNPIGTTIVNLGRVTQGGQFEFTADQNGAYTMHFDNSFSIFSAKIVNLSYDATLPTVAGTDPILLIVLVVVALIIVAVILSVRKKSKEKKIQ
ncbi:MAG: emp24/gp25L/p24 family protein [Tenericutes bacterium]|nr:emp24/gp25L/p24 family protein [Mycoplasmatota bacterium]